ncbi:hypothetical protein ACB098_02G168800 [Castanea mollissima]
MSSTTQSSLPNSDIFLWKRKEQSMVVLLISTATWVLLEVYQFSFLTVISWAAMLVGKDVTDMSWLEISEESTIEMVNGIRAWIEEGIRWINLLRKSEIYMRVCVCIVTGMTVPVLYMKYEDNIRRQMEWVKGQSRRFYVMIDEKVVKNMKNKIVKVKKEKNVE